MKDVYLYYPIRHGNDKALDEKKIKLLLHKRTGKFIKIVK